MIYYLRKYWFFLGIAVVFILAFRLTALNVFFREWNIFRGAIFAAFLTTGLTLQTREILDQIRNMKGLGGSLISCFILFPLIAFVLAKVFFPNDPDLVVGAAILGIVPVTIASGTVLTQLAGGNVSLSLLICIATNLIGIFTIPFSLKLLLSVDQPIELPIWQMIQSLVVLVLVPTVIGQILRIWIAERISRWRKGFSIFNQAVVLLIIFNAAAGSTEQIIQAGWHLLLIGVFVILLHLIILAMNRALAGLIGMDRASVIAFTIHTSQKTLTVSFLVWSGYLSHYALAMIPIIAYHLVQLVVDTTLAEKMRSTAHFPPSSKTIRVNS